MNDIEKEKLKSILSLLLAGLEQTRDVSKDYVVRMDKSISEMFDN